MPARPGKPCQSKVRAMESAMLTSSTLPSDSPPVTMEDLERLGVDLNLYCSRLVAHRSRQNEDPPQSRKAKPILEVLDRVRGSITAGSFSNPQTHSEQLVRSAAVDSSVRFGSFRVLSEVCLAHGLAPESYMLSDKTDFKIDRVSFRSDDLTVPSVGGRMGDSFSVKLLRLYSRSQRKLVATKQVQCHLLTSCVWILTLPRGSITNRRDGG